ncbi:MAG: hypothetical protein J0I06_24850 [Planctomycetes bacterium]|nr:hypothetical protein [Planctomycetota bacterium]
MSRFRMLALACACGLTLTIVPAVGDEPLTDAQKEKNLERVLREKAKTKIESEAVGELSVSEVLKKISKEHGIEIVVSEEAFRAAGITGFKDRKSFLRSINPAEMTVPQFLDVWLASVGATYKIELPRIVIVPAPRWNEKLGEFDRTDRAAVVLATFEQEIQLKEGTNINEIPLFELLQDLSKRYQLTFVVNEESFKAVGSPNIREEKARIATTHLRGLRLPQFLNVTLESVGATYLLKNDVIEIVSIPHAAKVTKSGISQEEDGRGRLNEPLVAAIVKEKPLNEVVARIAEMYDLTVVVSPQAGDARTGFVTARLLNVPADKALELLALQCDLRVVRRGAAYFITSRDHANELFGEKLEKERQLIEVQKLREAPAKPPAPPAPPEKPLAPAPEK